MLDPTFAIAAIIQFAGRKNAIEKPLAMTVDNRLQAGAFDQINAVCDCVHTAISLVYWRFTAELTVFLLK